MDLFPTIQREKVGLWDSGSKEYSKFLVSSEKSKIPKNLSKDSKA